MPIAKYQPQISVTSDYDFIENEGVLL